MHREAYLLKSPAGAQRSVSYAVTVRRLKLLSFALQSLNTLQRTA